MKMGFWSFILDLDRRWIFLLVGIVVIIPLVLPIGFPTVVTPPVQNLYEAVDSIEPNSKPLLICFDYSPDTSPELDPMAYALMRHCFSKDIKMVMMALYPEGAGMAQRAIDYIVSTEFPEKKSGEDYVFLGFMPGVSAVILSMGRDIANTFPNDGYGVDIEMLPMMEDIHNYEDIPLMIDLSGSATPKTWLTFANAPYKQRVGVGTTAVSAAEYYPYLQTGQFAGMMGGLKGAAEYEELNSRDETFLAYFEEFYEGKENAPENKQPRRTATIGMDSQSLVHLLIMFLIVLGNIAYFATRKS